MSKELFTSLEDLEFISPKNSPTDILGFGALSQVRKVRLRSNGEIYALKEMNLNAIHQNDIKNIEREVKMQRQLEHPNIIHLYGSVNTRENMMFLLLEFAENNNLFHYIQKNNIDEKNIHRLFFQTLQGIEYIHKKNIMHRDLKPENILLDKKFNAKICDFGWCAEYNEYERRQTFCGTNEYMAPEILDQKKQDFMIDIWALGILLFEMYHKRAPFTGRNPKDIYKSIHRRQIPFKASPMCAEAKDLIDKILQIDPRRRPTIEQIFAHPYFNKYPFFRIDDPNARQGNPKFSRRSYAVGSDLAFGDRRTGPPLTAQDKPGASQAPRMALQQTLGSYAPQQPSLFQPDLGFKKLNSAPIPLLNTHQHFQQSPWPPAQSAPIGQLQSYQPLEVKQATGLSGLHSPAFGQPQPSPFPGFGSSQPVYLPQASPHQPASYLLASDGGYPKLQTEEMKVLRSLPTGPVVISSTARKEYPELQAGDLQRSARGSYEIGSASIRPLQQPAGVQYSANPEASVYQASFGSLR